MNRYYLSLCRGLVGYFVAFNADSENVVREHAAKYFGRLWCSVYTPDEITAQISKGMHVRIINADSPICLGNCPEYE